MAAETTELDKPPTTQNPQEGEGAKPGGVLGGKWLAFCQPASQPGPGIPRESAMLQSG